MTSFTQNSQTSSQSVHYEIAVNLYGPMSTYWNADDGQPIRFASLTEAEAALEDFLIDCGRGVHGYEMEGLSVNDCAIYECTSA